MASVMAIISKAVFERTARTARVGDVLPMRRYESTHRALEPLASGGDLYLVTVRPPSESLWLVAVLRAPRREGEGWEAAANTAPIADIGGLRERLRFASGRGLTAAPGALGMALQTPRPLTPEDVALLDAAAGGAAGAAPTAGDAAPAEGASSARPRRDPAPPRPARALDDGAVERALAGLAGESTRELTRRVIALGSLPPDRRVADALCQLLEDPPYTSGSMRPMWQALLQQLSEHHVDRASLARLRAVNLGKSFGSTNMFRWLSPRLESARAALAARFPDEAAAPAPPPITARARLPRLCPAR
jgi:hypothetical protein